MMRNLREENGQVLVMTAVSMVLLLGFMGFAADVGQLFHERRGLQAAVDSAVIAAAITYKAEMGAGATSSTITTDMKNAATAALSDNGFTSVTVTSTYSSAVNSPTLFFSSPPADGPNVGTAGFMEGILTVPEHTIFMSLFGFHTMNEYARAVAGIGGANGEGCIIALNKTDADTMDFQGSFLVTAPGCGVIDASSAPDALQFTGGGGSLSAGWVAVTGGDGGQIGDSTPAPIINTGAVVNDPYGTLEGPSASQCSSGGTVSWTAPWGSGTTVVSQYSPTAAETSANNITLTGGTTASPLTGPGTDNATCYTLPVTLNNVVLGPGIYVFEQGVTLSGSVTGIGVTLDLLGGGLTIPTGGVSFGTALTCDPTSSSSCASTAQTDGLVAPTSGWTDGIAIMEAPGNTSQITIQKGNATGNITGAIYAPSAQLYLQDSGSDTTGGGLSFVGDIIVNKLYDETTTMSVYDYASVYPTTNPLKTVTLVE